MKKKKRENTLKKRGKIVTPKEEVISKNKKVAKVIKSRSLII